MKKKLLGFGIIIFFIAITIRIVLINVNPEDFVRLYFESNKVYIALGLLALVVSWCFDASALYQLIKITGTETSWWYAFKLTMIGQYYSLITPSSTGGQPAQIYYMNKDNITVGKGTAILVNKFVVFQTTVTLYSLILSLFGAGIVFRVIKPAAAFIIVGFLVNIMILLGIVLLIYNPKAVEKMVYGILKFAHKIKLVKNIDEKLLKLEEQMSEYKINIPMLIQNKKLAIKAVLFTALQLTAFFSVTYFVHKGLNLNGSNLIEILSLQAFLFIAVSFVPIPGTIGASEAAFYAIFGAIFAPGVRAFAMIAWRGITYYINIIVTGFYTLGVYLWDRHEIKHLEIEK